MSNETGSFQFWKGVWLDTQTCRSIGYLVFSFSRCFQKVEIGIVKIFDLSEFWILKRMFHGKLDAMVDTMNFKQPVPFIT